MRGSVSLMSCFYCCRVCTLTCTTQYICTVQSCVFVFCCTTRHADHKPVQFWRHGDFRFGKEVWMARLYSQNQTLHSYYRGGSTTRRIFFLICSSLHWSSLKNVLDAKRHSCAELLKEQCTHFKSCLSHAVRLFSRYKQTVGRTHVQRGER